MYIEFSWEKAFKISSSIMLQTDRRIILVGLSDGSFHGGRRTIKVEYFVQWWVLVLAALKLWVLLHSDTYELNTLFSD